MTDPDPAEGVIAGVLEVPGRFDALRLVEHTHEAVSGRTVRFVDTGPVDGIPLLVLTGGGTSARAIELLEFARSLRECLGVRLIAVERNGFGRTTYQPDAGFAEYAADVWDVLDSLGVSRPSIAAISGGGPYSAHVVAAHPERVRSYHLTCAVSDLGLPVGPEVLETALADPVAWWIFPPGSSTHAIPGFAEAVVDEATRSRFAQGTRIPPQALRREGELLSTFTCPDLDALTAPTFLVWGADDPIVTIRHAERWQECLGGRARLVVHPGEGHDVQYRHWDQILTDAATLGELVLVSEPASRVSRAVPHSQLEQARAAGDILGYAAWLPDAGPTAAPAADRIRTPYEGEAGRAWNPTAIEAPLRLHHTRVPPTWVDYNDHMSESCFLLAFGDDADAFFRYIGIDEAYRDAGHSLFSAETHLVHQGEAGLGDPIAIALHVLGVDEKRVHILHVMTNADTGRLLATGEQMLLHVDTAAGTVTPMPPELLDRIRAIVRAHHGLPTPVAVGRAIRTLPPPEPEPGTAPGS